MIIALLTGAIVGFLLAIPPGPIGVVIVTGGLKGEVRKGLAIGWGAAVMDIVYCIVITLALSAVTSTVGSFFDSYPHISLLLQAAVIAAMVAYGFVNLRVKRTPLNVPRTDRRGRMIERFSHNGPFFIGVGMALANLANPTFVPSLMYFIATIQNFEIFAAGMANNLMFSIGFGLGTVGWIYLLIRLVVHFRKRMTPDFIEGLHRFAGLTFVGFGAYLGYRVVAFTKWSEIFRIVFAF